MEKREKKDKEIRLSIQKSQYVNNRSSRKRNQSKSEMETEMITERQNFPRTKGYIFKLKEHKLPGH